MEPLSVVLLQSDPEISQSLAASLCNCFHSVHAVPSVGELRPMIARHRADVVIVDMEMLPVVELERLCREFPAVCIVCTHRLADEHMWTEALTAGAADIFPASDTRGILNAALRRAGMTRAAAA